MKSIQKTREELPNLLLVFNLIILIIGLFGFNRGLFITSIIVNVLFLLTYYIIKKYGTYFELLMNTKRLGNMATKLNNLAGR